MLTVEQVHNLVQQKIARLSDRAWEQYDREGVEFTEEGKSLCEFTRLHAMDELLQYRAQELTYPQLEEFYATALQAGGYEDMPFLPFDFSFLNVAVYVVPTGGMVQHTHTTSEVVGLEQFIIDVANSIIQDEPVMERSDPTTDEAGALKVGSKINGLTSLKILEKILFSYQSPVFQSFGQSKPLTYEVGQQLSGTNNFSWSITNPGNVLNDPDSGSITTSEPNIFTPMGNFNLFGTTGKSLSTVTPYTKNTIGSLVVTLNGKNSNGAAMTPISLTMNWLVRIYYLNSLSEAITAATVQAGNSFLSATRHNATPLSIVDSGFKYVWIPDIIAQAGISFYDPVNNFLIDMESPVNLTVTNPQGLALPGKLYRTTNELGGTLTVNIN